MSLVLVAAFLLMGFTFTITQGVFVREFLVAFTGNELSIGLLLANWLLLEALGSGLLGRLADRIRNAPGVYAALQVILSLCFPPALTLTYLVRGFLGVIPGEGIGFLPILFSTLLILAPLGLIDGAMFTFGSRACASLTGDTKAISQVYIYEAVGAILGGLAFTYLFVPYLSSVQTALLLMALNLASAASLLALAQPRPVPQTRKGGARRFVAIPLLLLAGTIYILVTPWAAAWQDWLAHKQWENYDLRFYGNSVYGNIAVTQRESQYTFYENGLPILTAPVPDIVLAEDLAHLPLLFQEKPQQVLVVSGGVGGVLAEILKHPVTRVDYAELDPLLITTVQRFPTTLTSAELGDPRVTIYYRDGRLVIKEKAWELPTHPGEQYQVVLVNLPYPSTLQLNRFYTKEFFLLARQVMANDGILAITLPGSLTYMGPELRALNATLETTLHAVFPQVRPIPGDTGLFLASPAANLAAVTPEMVLQRAQERGVQATILTDTYLRYRLDEGRLRWFQEMLRRGERPRSNEDLNPAGVFTALAYWNALFSPEMSGYWAILGRLSLPGLALPLLGIALLIFIFRRRATAEGQWPIPLAIATTGVAGMTLDLVIVFAFQAFHGYVYEQIGLLIPAFMAGLSLGGWLMTRWLSRRTPATATLVWTDLGVLLYLTLLPLAMRWLSAAGIQAWSTILVQPLLLLLNALGGFLVGLEFPLASHLYLPGRGVGQTAGLLYAVDLLGALWGALLVSAAFLPALGIRDTCLALAALKVVSLSALLSPPAAERV